MSLPVVVVEWIDSCGGPDTVDPHDLPAPVVILTAGHLAQENDDMVTIIQDVFDDGRFRSALTIPACSIRDIKRMVDAPPLP